MNQYEILSRIYEILGSSSAEEIDRAAESAASSKRIYSALKSLANLRRRLEREQSGDGKSSRGVDSSRVIANSGEVQQSEYAAGPAVLKLFSQASEELTNEKMAADLNRIGLPLRFNKSDGKRRMADKLSRCLADMSSAEIESLYDYLMQLWGDMQTRGWYSAIRDR